MRIAYIAPYQGSKLLETRPLTNNLALAANLKIELIAELLTLLGHEVEIISQGEVVKNSIRFYSAFTESAGKARIPVYYASAFPVRFVNGYWSGRGVLSILKERHAEKIFDAVIIYNLKNAQVMSAFYATDRLRLPVIVEFEDDSFVDVRGKVPPLTFKEKWQRTRDIEVLKRAAGSICVSPHLQTRFDKDKPTLLLRGMISSEIAAQSSVNLTSRKNIVAFSGTFTASKGLAQLIGAWRSLQIPGWELHIAGDGVIAGDLRQLASDVESIRFRGLLDRNANAAFLGECKIGINPHDLSSTPGNVFAFKIIEYLAAGLHVISTPMGPLEPELEYGMTYIDDNSALAIANGLRRSINEQSYRRQASEAATQLYGEGAVAKALEDLLSRAVHLSETKSVR